MPLSGTRTFVGFGFGAIQTGLFLYEAQQSGNFGRLVVAEVQPDVVQAVRAAGGLVTVNIAHAAGVEAAQIGPVELLNPAEAADRARLIEAVAQADELATAVPAVEYYVGHGPGSLHQILADGLSRKVAGGPPAVIYTAENHPAAAQTLQAHLLEAISPAEQPAALARVRVLNTVIGKMSRVITDPAEIEALQLTPLTPNGNRAILAEGFNRILISKIQLDDFSRGITIFEEKPDLQPFEEAKLYGHNALHAVAGYLARRTGLHSRRRHSGKWGGPAPQIRRQRPAFQRCRLHRLHR
jgi:mannitol-1-phosphate/altronate dehydrogenase